MRHCAPAWGRTFARYYAVQALGFSLKPFLQASGTNKCRTCGQANSGFSLFICPACFRAGFGPMFHTNTECNPFDLFELMRGEPMRFKVDVKKLEQEYKRRLWFLHPDIIQARGGSERDLNLASIESSYLSNAFRTLLDPISRSEAIFKWCYHEKIDETDAIDDLDLMMTILDDVETIEQLKLGEDLTSVVEIAGKWRLRYNENLKQLATEFKLLEEAPDEPSSSADCYKAKKIVKELRLILKAIEAADEKLSGVKER